MIGESIISKWLIGRELLATFNIEQNLLDDGLGRYNAVGCLRDHD